MVLQSDATKLIHPKETYPKVKHESLIDKYKIPVQHFEYSYIETCKDGRELEKIVQVLRSGQEGYFPDLTRFAENRLAVVKPKSKLLTKACPVISKENLNNEEKNELIGDLTRWISNVSKDDDELAYFKNRKSGNTPLPEVRKTLKTEKPPEEKKPVKRISSTDYSSWEKYDPDTEILKMDLEDEKLKKAANQKEPKKYPKKTVQFKEFTTEAEALHEANYEKDKGNEFFKAGDFKQALKHYTNSINCKPTLAGFNNRALAHIKLKKFENAIDDCSSALSIESNNVKALLRKAQALDGLGQHTKALETIEQAIEVDPNNAVAQELAEKFRKLCGIISKSTRFVVQEIETDDKEKTNQKNEKTKEKVSKNKEVIIPIPGTSTMSPPHYITCSNGNPDKIKEETMRANTPSQIVHLVSIDNSDVEDDDSCTVNHLKKICKSDHTNKICVATDVKAEIKHSVSCNKEEKNNPNTEKAGLNIEETQKCQEKEKIKSGEITIKPHENHEEVIEKQQKQKETLPRTHKTNTETPNVKCQQKKDAVTTPTKKTVKQQEIIKKDKHAGGEPYMNENEHIDVSRDIHSPYNFLKAWNSANADKTLEQHALILKSIDMNRITGVIGCKLDNAMFTTIIRCLCMHFAVPGEVSKLNTILRNIVNVPRFDIISMLMSAEDRNNINTLINFLKQHGKPLSEDVINKFIS